MNNLGCSVSNLVASYLLNALCLAERQQRPAYKAMADSLSDTDILVCIDAEQFFVCGLGSMIRIQSEGRENRVSIATNTEVLVCLVNGETTILQACLSEEMRLVGRLSDLENLERFLQWFVRALVRCPESESLKNQFITELRQVVEIDNN